MKTVVKLLSKVLQQWHGLKSENDSFNLPKVTKTTGTNGKLMDRQPLQDKIERTVLN
jgi:hypothetical protein